MLRSARRMGQAPRVNRGLQERKSNGSLRSCPQAAPDCRCARGIDHIRDRMCNLDRHRLTGGTRRRFLRATKPAFCINSRTHEFVALAMPLGVKLVTEDKKLLKAFPKLALALSAA